MGYKRPWNSCNVCGRFIKHEDFVNGKAVNLLIAPSSEFCDESYDTYHTACDAPPGAHLPPPKE